MQDKNLQDFLPDKNKSYYKSFENTNFINNINQQQIIECIKTVMDP